MGEQEQKVQKLFVNYCKLLPKFVETWSNVLQKSVKCVESLCNQAEQLRHVSGVDMEEMNDSENVKKRLGYLISEGIEEQICFLKGCLDILNKENYDFKNKLSQLESSSLKLQEDCSLMQGSATQPRLNNLLQLSLDFWLYFSGSLKKINDCYKNIDIKNEKSMSELEKSIKNVSLVDRRITYLLALTQYVGSEKALIVK